MTPPSNARGLAIYGAGGLARQVSWLVSSHRSSTFELVGFIDDSAQPDATLAGYPVFDLAGLSRAWPGVEVAVGVGDPYLRERLAGKAAQAGFAPAVLRSHLAHHSDSVTFSDGVILCAGSILTVDIVLGAYVLINMDCTVSHDVVLGDYATLSPGVHVAGNVHVGRHVYIGLGANIINGRPDDPLVIGEGCVIAAGSCVTASTEPNALYAGVPAVLKKRLDTA